MKGKGAERITRKIGLRKGVAKNDEVKQRTAEHGPHRALLKESPLLSTPQTSVKLNRYLRTSGEGETQNEKRSALIERNAKKGTPSTLLNQ